MDEFEDAAEVTISDVVPFCVTQLGLQGLACLAACSKDLQSTCLLVVQSDARSLLDTAVAAVRAAHRTSGSRSGAHKEHKAVQEQHRQAVVWLLLAVPAVAAAATTADVLCCVQHYSRSPMS
jgi:hypothetical protein